MNPVEPVSSGLGGAASPRPISPGDSSSVQPASQSGGGGMSISMTTSTTMTSVYSQVDAMLGNFGSEVSNNQMLKMIIGFLILQALLAGDGGNQQAGAAGLLDMLGQSGSDRQSQIMSMHSATNVVQIEQQSTVLLTDQAVVGSQGVEGDPNDSGQTLDLSA